MKNFRFGVLAATLIAISQLLTGCGDAPCKDVTCVRGACIEGSCICEDGYEGVSCETKFNEKFLGTFSLEETCSGSGAAGPYAVTVAPKSDTDVQFTIVGLWEVPSTIITADIGTEGTSFSIGRQPIMTGFDIGATGGTISTNGNTINVTYKIYPEGANAPSDQCTATLTKI